MEILWTDKARKAVALAFRVAQRRNEAEVTPTALLLGLLEQPRSVARDLLTALKLDSAALREAVEALPTSAARPGSSAPVLSATAAAVLNYAERLAQRRRLDSVGTDALLAALLDRADLRLFEALRSGGADPEALLKRLFEQLRGSDTWQREKAEPHGPGGFEEIVLQSDTIDLLTRILALYEREKEAAARREDFATAAVFRDRIRKLKEMLKGK